MLKSRCQIAVFDIICFPAVCDSHSTVYVLPASGKLVPDGFSMACDAAGPIINQKTVPQTERTEGRAVDVFHINVTAKLFPFSTAPPSIAWLQYKFDVHTAVHHNIISIVKPTSCTNISNLFYFGMTLYMFRTVFPFIIRSSRLYIQQQAFVKQILLYVQS